MISLELLAPALNVSTAKAAILAGADAVYIGGPGFSARQQAHNELEELRELCSFAHQFKVKVHVAVNTLLKDEELPQAYALIEALGEIGADAVIVQDLALLYANFPPGLEVHASTQCLVNTKEKLKFYASLGFSQIVLPRETTLPEIAMMHEYCPEVTLEAFISGALCVSESGNCFISERLLDRSGNRGCCAQLCRLPMELKQQGRVIASGYLLSMKDNLSVPLLADLIHSGVRSFKIEGRLKPVEYVINQVSYLRECLDKIISQSQGLYVRASGGALHKNFVPDLNKTFNRGFTHELLLGTNEALVNPKTPKFQGEPVGTVKNVTYRGAETVLELIPSRKLEFHNQDGFTYFKDGKLTGFACNTAKGSFLTVHGRLALSAGAALYRNHDALYVKALTAKGAFSRQVSCKLKLKLSANTVSLLVEDEFGRRGEAKLSFEYRPELGALREEKLLSTLKKSFSPYFYATKVEYEGDLNLLTLPLSALNTLRKEAYGQLMQQLGRSNPQTRFTLPEKLPSYPASGLDQRLVLNQKSAAFFKHCGLELSAPAAKHEVLMTCRHCLIKAHALCHKEGGSTKGFTLCIGKHEFRLLCDCKACKMMVLNG